MSKKDRDIAKKLIDEADSFIVVTRLKKPAGKASIQDELNRQIAQSEQNLESELLGVITSFKSRCDKNISRRNALRTSLVELAKAKSIKNQENPRFRLLEQREKEVEDLQNRYELAVSKWRFAKESLIFDSETEQPKK